MKYTVVLFIAIMISGCSILTPPARDHELDKTKSYWFDYDISRRGTIVSCGDARWKSCAEPAPDAAIKLIAELEGKLKVADRVDAAATGALNQSIVKMAEKTQMVMFLRESLYRLCELSINTDLDAKQAEKLYAAVIGASLVMVQKEKEEAEQGKIEAGKEKVEAEKGKIEADKEKVEAEKGKIEAEKAKVEAEKGKIEAETRLKSADEAQFIYNFLNVKKVDPKITEQLLKEMANRN